MKVQRFIQTKKKTIVGNVSSSRGRRWYSTSPCDVSVMGLANKMYRGDKLCECSSSLIFAETETVICILHNEQLQQD